MKVFRGLFLMADLDNDIPVFWRVFFIYMDFLKWFLLCHGKDAVTIHSYGDLWGVQAYLLFTELTSVSFFLRMSHTFDLATYNIPIVSMMFFFFFLEPKDGLVFESRASLITYCGFYSNCFQIHYAVRAVITILFLQFGCKQPQIKAESITLVIF